MRLYNTPTRSTEDVTPQQPGKLTVYTCGPTVYDYPHIGNWFTFLRYDTLVRTLRVQGDDVTWVMNITDVGHLVSDADEGEDKLEKGAKREGKTAWEVAAYYGDYFVQGLSRLNFLMPEVLPKATDHIMEQIDLVKTLEAKGHTYIIDDGVYFDTSTFPDYNKLDGHSISDDEHARVEPNPQKRQPSDFALWKFSPEGEQRDMEWDSPWGKGFPGWHLECSAMAMKYLGETIDIHAGGVDHIPVHHKNEIAQSEAATGKRFANYWMHANHISVNGEKISKSLGNSVTLEDIETKGYSLMAVRLHALESHYRTQSKFSWDGLEAAQNRLRRLQEMADWRFQLQPDAFLLGDDYFDNLSVQIKSALQDDLNTPQALAILSQASDYIETKGIGIHPRHEVTFGRFLTYIDSTLGLNLLQSSDITPEQRKLITERETARQSKDWTRSDELRSQLAANGLTVKDTATGPTWMR